MTVMTLLCLTFSALLVVTRGHFRVESNTISAELATSTKFQGKAIASVSQGGQIVIGLASSPRLEEKQQHVEPTNLSTTIPNIIHILMMKPAFSKPGLEMLSQAAKANVMRNVAMNPGFQLKIHGDDDCMRCIGDSKFPDLAKVIANAEWKSGNQPAANVCRACLLFSEGGWYVDVDVEMAKSFSSLATRSESFVGGWSAVAGGQSSLLGASQGSIFINEWLSVMSQSAASVIKAQSQPRGNGNFTHVGAQHDRVPHVQEEREGSFGWGADTIGNALKNTANNCGDKQLTYPESSREVCGKRVRLFLELDWDSADARRLVDSRTLQVARSGRETAKNLARYAFFSPIESEQGSDLVAYQRFQGCSDWGCGMNGGQKIYPEARDLEGVAPTANSSQISSYRTGLKSALGSRLSNQSNGQETGA